MPERRGQCTAAASAALINLGRQAGECLAQKLLLSASHSHKIRPHRRHAVFSHCLPLLPFSVKHI